MGHLAERPSAVKTSKGWSPIPIEDLPTKREKPEVCPACGVYGFHRFTCPLTTTGKKAAK